MATHLGNDRWRSTFDQQYPNAQVPFSTVFPGSKIPDWFLHNGKGHEVNIDVAPDWYDRNFLGFALCCYGTQGQVYFRGLVHLCNLDLHDLSSELESSWVCSFTDAHTHQLEYTSIVLDQLWLAYVPSFLFFNDKKWSHIKFSFSTSGKSCIMKRWGVCPLHTKGSSDGDYSNGVKTSNDNDIDDDSNPSGSVLDDLREWGLEDTIIRRSLEEGRPRGHAYEDVNGSVLPDTIMRSFHEANSQAWKQDRIQMQLNPPISNTGTDFWVFITIFYLPVSCSHFPFGSVNLTTS